MKAGTSRTYRVIFAELRPQKFLLFADPYRGADDVDRDCGDQTPDVSQADSESGQHEEHREIDGMPHPSERSITHQLMIGSHPGNEAPVGAKNSGAPIEQENPAEPKCQDDCGKHQ